MDNNNDRLYVIKENFPFFHTSHLPNGDQILMSILMPQLIAVVFNPEGKFLRTMNRDLRHEIEYVRPGIYALDFKEDRKEMEEWENELGATPSAIAVKRFYLPDLTIGIRDIPDHFKEDIDHPELLDEEERQCFEEILRNWYEDGSYVLSWCEEYYMTKEGNIDST